MPPAKSHRHKDYGKPKYPPAVHGKSQTLFPSARGNSVVVDIVTLGESSVIRGGVSGLVKTGIREGIEQGAKEGVYVITTRAGGRYLGQSVNALMRALSHFKKEAIFVFYIQQNI
jgi:hypothetical protein